MSKRARVAIAVLLAAIAIDVTAVYTFVRLQHWHAFGWAGLSYIPAADSPEAEKATKEKMPARLQPGSVMFTYPGSPATRAGITTNDVIVAVNGVPANDRKQLQAMNGRLRTGDVIRYTLRSDQDVRTVDVRLESPLSNRHFVVVQSASFLAALLFVFIGLLVFIRRPDDRRATLLFAMSVFGALSLIGAISTSLDGSNARGVMMETSPIIAVAAGIGIFSMAFLPLTLHLALVFPRDRPVLTKYPALLRWVYAIPILAAGLIAAFTTATVLVTSPYAAGFKVGRALPTIGWSIAAAGVLIALRLGFKARRETLFRALLGRPFQTILAAFGLATALAMVLVEAGLKVGPTIVFTSAAIVPFVCVLLYPVLACFFLYRSYREAGPEEKRQVKWPLWGTIIALGTKILFGLLGFASGMLAFADGDAFANSMLVMQTLELVPRLAYILIPLSFAFAILKYRLMDIDVLIKKTVAYAMLSGTIVVLYLVLVGGVGTILVSMTGVRNQTLVVGATVVVALLFVPLRNRLQLLVDRNLFRQKYDYPQALQRLSEETVDAKEVSSFLQTSSEILQQALQTRSVITLALRNEEFVAVAKVGVADSVLGSLRLPLSQLSGTLLDRPFDPRRRELPADAAASLRRLDIALVVPVRSGGTKALLALGTKLNSRDYDVEDLDFLASAADQVAVAIDRIRLSREEEDYSQASEIQRGLLPSAEFSVNGFDVAGAWQPARTVGGDYYDIIDLGDERLGICIGDVAGKGMSAALLMSSLQAAVRASAADAKGAADLCERARRVVVSNLTGGRFVTFFYAIVDTRSGELTYCNAGHNPPLLVRASGDVIRLDAGGPAIARIFRDRFAEGTTSLAAGDRLLLFTDGASEATNPAQEIYGEDNLAALLLDASSLPARQLASAVVDAVTTFAAGELEDDLTLVAVTRRA